MNLPESWGGRFAIHKKLGEGGLGVVYHALDVETEDEVALKVLKVPPTGSRLERFEREGKLTASLDHPGIVRVHAAGVIGGQPYLAYELVPGAHTLGQVFQHATLQRKLELIRDAARALGYAHERGVWHRDVKPANILVDLAGQVRVADFGLATGADLERLTMTGAMLGTPTHIAPEMTSATLGERGPPADVWGLGVILYQALAGQLPFQAPNPATLLYMICKQDPLPPSQHAPGVSTALEAVCLRALRRDPAQRYSNADAFAEALEAAMDGAGTTGPSRSPALGLGGAAALLVLGGALAWALSGDPQPETPQDPDGGGAVVVAPDTPPEERADPLAELRKQAEEGGPEQALAFARALLDADPADPSEAAVWLTRAGPHPPAQHALAELHASGVGVSRDEEHATSLYREAAHAGHVPSMGPLAKLLLAKRGKEGLNEAIAWIEQGERKDDAACLRELGTLHYEGRGVKKDPRAAVRYWTRAADQGDVEGSARRGIALLRGEGIDKDPQAGAVLLHRAAEAGHVPAMVPLGYCYESGRGVEEDAGQAVTWYRRSAESGSIDGMNRMSEAYALGKGVDVDSEKAIEWGKRAVDAGSVAALDRVGYLYQRRGEYAEARRWFEKSVGQNDVNGMFNLGILLRNGRGGAADPAGARELFERAAKRGHTSAMVALAEMLRSGEGGERDPVRATELLRKAAGKGHEKAKRMLRR